MTAPLDGLFVPAWASADSLLGFAVGSEGSLELAHQAVEGGGPVGEPVASGVEVERVTEIDDNDLDTGKEAMLFRYRYRNGAANDLARLDVASLEYGPTIPVEGLVSWAISRTGDRIASGTTDGVVVFDGRTGERVGAIEDSDLRGVFITVADQLFVGSLGGELTQYDLETLEPIRTFGGSRGHVAGGTGTADGSLVAIYGGDRNAALFDVASGVRIGGPISIDPEEHNVVRMSLDGRWMAVGGQPQEAAGGSASAGRSPSTRRSTTSSASHSMAVDGRRRAAARGRRRQRGPDLGPRPRALGGGRVPGRGPEPHEGGVGRPHRRPRPLPPAPAQTSRHLPGAGGEGEVGLVHVLPDLVVLVPHPSDPREPEPGDDRPGSRVAIGGGQAGSAGSAGEGPGEPPGGGLGGVPPAPVGLGHRVAGLDDAVDIGPIVPADVPDDPPACRARRIGHDHAPHEPRRDVRVALELPMPEAGREGGHQLGGDGGDVGPVDVALPLGHRCEDAPGDHHQLHPSRSDRIVGVRRGARSRVHRIDHAEPGTTGHDEMPWGLGPTPVYACLSTPPAHP